VAEQQGLELAMAYGITEALFATHPELRKVYELFKQDNIGAAIEALYATNWYKNTSGTVKLREKQKLEQPKVYAENVVKYKINARKRLVNAGIRIDNNTFDKLAEDAYARNLSDDQLDLAIVNSNKITGYGGNVLGEVNELKNYAFSMGVSNLYNDTYWNQKSKDLFSGTTTINDVQEEIKKLASSAYPAYAEGISLGQSVESQTTNVIRTISEFLEIDEDVAMRHPVFKQIMGYKDPTTNKFAQMPQWLVERTVKSTSDWPYTKNALAAFDTVGMRPLSDFGVMYGS